MWIAGVLLAFILPVIYIVIKEWRSKKASEKDNGPVKKKEPISWSALAKVTVILFLLILPVLYLSDASYSFYDPRDSALKIAFKHSGKKVSDCEEADMIKKAGEQYRRELKDTRQVKMSNTQIGKCPRERYPVVVEFHMDGKEVLNKAYSPTGLKKDMASYIFEEFLIPPGIHRLSAKLYRNGPVAPADFTLDETVDFKPGEIKVIRFDEKSNMLLVE